MNTPAYMTVFRDQYKYFGKSTVEEIKDMRESELCEWSYADDEEWCRKIMPELTPDADNLDKLKVLLCLQQNEGKAKIISYIRTDKVGFYKCLNAAARDHNLIDSSESWIIPFSTKGGTKLQYVPSIHAQFADWRMANPDSSLVAVAWSKFELECWMKATGEYRAPNAGDTPKASSQEEAMKLITHSPQDPDYELAGIQLIKTQGCPGGTLIRESHWYNVQTLDEYAQNSYNKKLKFSPWSGATRKTDPIEMYKKTAKRNFIKNDSGPVFLRAKSERRIGGE